MVDFGQITPPVCFHEHLRLNGFPGKGCGCELADPGPRLPHGLEPIRGMDRRGRKQHQDLHFAHHCRLPLGGAGGGTSSEAHARQINFEHASVEELGRMKKPHSATVTVGLLYTAGSLPGDTAKHCASCYAVERAERPLQTLLPRRTRKQSWSAF